MIDDPECVEPIPEDLLDALDEEFEDVVTGFAKEIEKDCAATMEEAYQISGCRAEKGAISESSSSAEGVASKDVIAPILLRGTSLFRYERSFMSYAGILKSRANTPYDKRPAEWHKDLEVPEGVIGFASALLRHMSLPENASMVSLEKLGRQFCCQRCLWDNNFGEKLSWSALVSAQ